MIRIRTTSVLTPLGCDPATIHQQMMEGKSAITLWHDPEKQRGKSKIGGDLSNWDLQTALNELLLDLPKATARRTRMIVRKAPREIQYTIFLVLKAWQEAGLEIGENAHRTGVIVAGNNLNSQQRFDAYRQFVEDADWMEPLFSVFSLDTVHAAIASDILGLRGVSYSLGAACASGLFALRAAAQEITSGKLDRVIVVAPVFEMPAPELEALTNIDAIATKGLNDDPTKASCPFSSDRYGFVPAEGGACLILEKCDKAVKGDILLRSVAANVDGMYEPVPNKGGQVAVMRTALDEADVNPEDIGLVSAHATSTPVGDRCEIQAISEVFSTSTCPLTAAKANLGHTMWAAAAVETVIALEQLKRGEVPSQLNSASIDPECVWDVHLGQKRSVTGSFLLKNSFGFGGYNSAAIFELLK